MLELKKLVSGTPAVERVVTIGRRDMRSDIGVAPAAGGAQQRQGTDAQKDSCR